jgi:ubiquinone/menaquinone biosynthesis C-methylase UbiE
MTPEEDSGSAVRTANQRLAAHYDAMPYVPEPEPMLDLARVWGLSALYGLERPPEPSVLDLGCGVGVQLERLARETAGPITGADISASACAAARQRLIDRRDQVQILEADLLDLSPGALGRFDTIYAVGILFLVPDAVRERLFDLIGECLSPGGVTVLSYYAGSMGALRPTLNRLLRSRIDPEASRSEQVRSLRGALRELGGQLRQTGPSLQAHLVQILASYNNDATLFHEVLGGDVTPTGTGEIEAALSQRGLEFLSYLHPMPYCGLPTSVQRAQGADLFDFLHGGYRYAAFVKGSADAPSAARCQRWQTGLRRRMGPAGYGQTVEYQDPALGSIRTASAPVQAALDQLAHGPATRDALCIAVRAALDAQGLGKPDGLAAMLDDELQPLWQAGWLTPLDADRPLR